MHAVFGDILDADRKKGAGPDMKRDLGNADSRIRQRGGQLRREMQPGGGRGDGAGLGREHRLVIPVIGIGAAVGTADIGWQRHAAMGGKSGFDGCGAKGGPAVRVDEGDADLAPLAAPAHPRGKAVRETDHIVRPAFAGRLGESLPVGPALMLVKGDADAGLAPAAGEPCRDHPCVVDHQKIARPQQRRQVPNDPVMDGRAIEIEKPRRIPRAGGFGRDGFRRQLIIEIG